MNDQRRILLVDDEPVFLTSTAGVLRNAGYACETAHSVDEGRLKMSEIDFDLLVSDINMPGNDNLEMLEYVGIAPVPVLVLTGHPTVESAVASMRKSVVDYLIKPVSTKELVQRVESAMQTGAVVRRVNEAQKTLTDSLKNLEGLQSTLRMRSGASAHATLPMDLFLGLALQNILESVVTMQATMRAAHSVDAPPQQDLCRLFQCPRLKCYQQAVHETIAVLEKTRHSFKSKELGALRKTLESLLAGDLDLT